MHREHTSFSEEDTKLVTEIEQKAGTLTLANVDWNLLKSI